MKGVGVRSMRYDDLYASSRPFLQTRYGHSRGEVRPDPRFSGFPTRDQEGSGFRVGNHTACGVVKKEKKRIQNFKKILVRNSWSPMVFSASKDLRVRQATEEKLTFSSTQL
jgi:hypothetical protein